MNLTAFWRATVAFAGVVALAAAIIRPWARPLLGAGAMILSIAAIWRSLQATEMLERRPPDTAWHPRQGSGRPNDLERLERAFGWKSYSPVDYDHMLRPRIGRLLAYRLRAKKGIDMRSRPDAARALVSEATWALAATDQTVEAPVDTATIQAAVEEIEAIA